MEGPGGHQACERAICTSSGNPTEDERHGDQRDRSDLPGRLCGHDSIAFSAATGSALYDFCNGFGRATSGYSGATQAQTAGAAKSGQGAASASGGADSAKTQQ